MEITWPSRLVATMLANLTAVAYMVRLRIPRKPAGSRTQRRALVLARGLPPHFHGGVFRQLSILNLLAEADWEIDAITDSLPAEPSTPGIQLVPRIPPQCRVHRWDARDSRASFRWSPQLSGGFESIAAILDSARMIRFPPTVVIATGPTFAEFIAGALLARRFDASLILDYRDEWTTNPLAFIERGPADGYWERTVLRCATACVCVTTSMADHLLATFPQLHSGKVVTIRNGWEDTGAFARERRATRRPADRAAIGFFGWLGEHWDFGEFLGTLVTVLDAEPGLRTRVQITVYGRVSPENREAINALGRDGPVIVHGLVSHGEAQEAMVACDAVLLLTSPKLARTLPGKTYEYLASGRPILLYGTEGEMPVLLRHHPGATIVPRGRPDALAAGLKRILSGRPEAEIAAAPADHADRHHRRHRNREWTSLLDSLGPWPLPRARGREADRSDPAQV